MTITSLFGQFSLSLVILSPIFKCKGSVRNKSDFYIGGLKNISDSNTE